MRRWSLRVPPAPARGAEPRGSRRTPVRWHHPAPVLTFVRSLRAAGLGIGSIAAVSPTHLRLVLTARPCSPPSRTAPGRTQVAIPLRVVGELLARARGGHV